jgi:hypothetical protein
MGKPIFILSQLTEDEEWEILSVHESEIGAKKRLKKVASEEEYDQQDEDTCLLVEEFKLQD